MTATGTKPKNPCRRGKVHTYMTGGLAADAGLLTAMREQVVEQKINVEVEAHPDSIYAGAIGAAL